MKWVCLYTLDWWYGTRNIIESIHRSEPVRSESTIYALWRVWLARTWLVKARWSYYDVILLTTTSDHCFLYTLLHHSSCKLPEGVWETIQSRCMKEGLTCDNDEQSKRYSYSSYLRTTLLVRISKNEKKKGSFASCILSWTLSAINTTTSQILDCLRALQPWLIAFLMCIPVHYLLKRMLACYWCSEIRVLKTLQIFVCYNSSTIQRINAY